MTPDIAPRETENVSKPMFGEELIWLFILGDMCTFTLFFFVYGHERRDSIELFRTSQDVLNIHIGSINTLILLASSWLVVLAIKYARKKQNATASKLLLSASGLGCIFACLKLIEYANKVAEGILFDTNNFYLFYYLLTGLHFAHLLTGIGVLLYFAYAFRKPNISKGQFAAFESGAIFWHMIDLLWIIIFPLIYLLP